jgi:hypothetical protein
MSCGGFVDIRQLIVKKYIIIVKKGKIKPIFHLNVFDG